MEGIKLTLPEDWAVLDNPNGPETYIDSSLEEPGVLQLSAASYVKGEIPNPTYDDLVSLSENCGIRQFFGTITGKQSGDCAFGKFGRADFSGSEYPFVSVWHLSDGKHFVLATFICSQVPSPKEMVDFQSILMTLKKSGSLFAWGG